MKRKICIIILLNTFLLSAFGQDVESVIKAEPFKWTGSVGTALSTQPKRGQMVDGSPFHYSVFGNFNISIYETFNIPLAFNYTQFGLNVDKPFYQFGMAPTYKWLKLHLGHSNMHFNSYTLSGHTFFGAGIELTPGKFRFAAMHGRLRDPVLIDALTGEAFMNPQFRRSGWGVKIGVGDFSNFLDIMLFKAADEAESILNWQDSIYQRSISGLTGKFAPQENLMIGLSSKLTLFKRATLTIEGGGSLFTADQSSTALVEDFPLFTPRTSTTFKWAAKSSLSFPLGPLYFTTTYERIQPDYYSLGTYNIVNDQENITVSPSGNFFRGRFSVNGMFGITRNNLMGNRSETTRRLISNINALIAPKPHYGLNVNYSNFSFRQQAEAILLNDSLLIRQVNSSFTFMPYFNIQTDTTKHHSINAAYIRQNVEDLNPVTRDFGSMQTSMLTANYSLIFTKGYQFSIGLSHTNINSLLINNTLTGVNLGLGYNIAAKGINLGLNSQLSSSTVNDVADGIVANTGLSANMKLQEKHQLRANLNWLRTNSKQFVSYSEMIFQLGYTYTIR